MNITQKLNSIYALLETHEKLSTITHSKNVSKYAISMCNNIIYMEDQLRLASALHDISVIIPKENWIKEATSSGIHILPEEHEHPLLLHQKLSKSIAIKKFYIADPEVLSAISCHTTLKTTASEVDLILFISDKIAWDGIGISPWQYQMEEGLKHSLHEAAYRYIDYLINRSDTLVHPSMREAYQWLSTIVNH
ncbi:MAG: HD domain-containing protein [Clostridiales bacterium]|nr:HD domain-containing protein [Clostridiales bacterium]